MEARIGCAEGALECGSVSYRLWLGFQAGSSAAAVQGASRIFMRGGEPKDHEVFARNDMLGRFSHKLQRGGKTTHLF